MLDLKAWIAKVTAWINGYELIVENKTTSSFNVSANTVLSATQTVNVAKTGYTPLGIVGIGSSNNNLNILRADISGNTGYIRAHNPTNSAINGVTVTLHVLYLKVGGVVRRLLNTLKTLTSERGWAAC